MVKQEAIIRYVADGFHLDCEKLLRSFCKLGVFTIDKFTELFVQAKFSFAYCGRETEDELREFSLECFMITLSYQNPLTNIPIRVGALFMLYCLYIKQPTPMMFSIRILHDQWKKLMELFEFGRKENHIDICYVITKLIGLKAFHYNSSHRLMGPMVTLTYEPKAVCESRIDKLKVPLKGFLENGSLEHLSSLHDNYMKKKNKLFGKEDGDFNLLLKNKYGEAKRILSYLIDSEDPDYVSAFRRLNTKTKKAVDPNIGNRRSDLKQKQYSAISYSHRMSRLAHFQNDGVLSDEDEDEDENMSDGPGMSVIDLLNSMGEPLAPTKKWRMKRKKAKPKRMRKRGRPSKIKIMELVNAEEESEEEEIPCIPGNRFKTLYRFGERNTRDLPPGLKPKERCKRNFHGYIWESSDEN